MVKARCEIQLAVSDTGLSLSEQKALELLETTGLVKFVLDKQSNHPKYTSLLEFLQYVAGALGNHHLEKLAGAFTEVIQACTTEQDFGGYGFNTTETLSSKDEAEVLFLCSAYLEAVKSAARMASSPSVQSFRPEGRRGMTMAEKIFAMHDVSNRGYVKPGDIIQVDVDWIIASELSWKVGRINFPYFLSDIVYHTD